MPSARPAAFGFSLLELLVVLLTAAILLSIAAPVYRQYALRAHRADAIRMMLAVADCQERIRADTGFYDTASCSALFLSERYDLRMEPEAEDATLAYTVIAEPKAADPEDRCGTLSLDQAGTRGIGGGDEHLASCWGGR